jgi:hypothetical protein
MQPAGRSRRFRTLVRGVAAFGAVIIGWAYCASALKREEPRLIACSPGRVYCASVVLVSNPVRSAYFVLRIKDMQHLTAWSHWANFGKGSTALASTIAGPSRLVWMDDRHLAAICDSCNLGRYDVITKKQTVGPVSISYTGFPPRAPYP